MKLRLVMAGIATSLAFGAAQATDLSKARYLAAACANCHGTNGNAVDGGFSLAGYPKDRFIDTMAGFKSGQGRELMGFRIYRVQPCDVRVLFNFENPE